LRAERMKGMCVRVLLLVFVMEMTEVRAQLPVAAYNSTACGDNTCADDAADGPICVNGKCKECNPEASSGSASGDCMCGANEYCVSDPSDSEYAKCRSYESSILGSTCDPGVTTVTKGQNDLLFCGKVVFDGNGTVDMIEWTGFCNKGNCEVCSERESASPVKCPDKQYLCRGGSWVSARLDIFSWSYLAANLTSFSTFLIFVWMYLVFPIALIVVLLNKDKLGLHFGGSSGGSKSPAMNTVELSSPPPQGHLSTPEGPPPQTASAPPPSTEPAPQQRGTEEHF